MTTLKDVASHVRAKNAGPFWITFDIFFDDAESFGKVVRAGDVNAETIAEAYRVDPSHVKIFELPDLQVIKVSFPRRVVQGAFEDRDMHSGQQHPPLQHLVVHV